MSNNIKAQRERLKKRREELRERERVRREMKVWSRKNLTALNELTRIQTSCRHLEKESLGRTLGNIWYKCCDCEKLIVESDSF